MPASEPVTEIFKMAVLDYPPADISKRLSDMGYTVPERRVKAMITRWGPELIQWVREEYMDDVAVAIFDYRKQITDKMTLLDRRFKEADQSYEDWKKIKNQTFMALLEEYRNEAAPDITKYIGKANAMTEGMNLVKLSKVLKDLHGEEAKLLELAAKIDAKLQATSVTNNTTINYNDLVTDIFEQLCDTCKVRLAEAP